MTGPRLSRAARRRASVAAVATALVLFAAACSSAPTPATTPSATTAAASGLKTIDKAALQSLVDETARQLMVPGFMVLLRTPQGEFTAASGTTTIGEQKLPTVDTHFRIASVTKTMTSAATLLLAQDGRLRLDDPVSKYVPQVPNGANITIAQLLEMRSGLYSFTDSDTIVNSLDNTPTRAWTPQELLDIAFAHPPNFAPGADYEYSNTNFVILGLIVEQLEGKPLATVFEDRLFKPLGLTNTMFPPVTSSTIPEPFSHGYLYGSSSTMMTGRPPYTPAQEAEAKAGTLKPKDYTDINHSFSFAAGAVTSTAADLATWIRALGGGKVFNAEYQKIWQDSAKMENPKNSYNWYGYGIDRASMGTERHRPARRPDSRLQQRSALRPEQRHDPRHLGQPHHGVEQPVHGRGAHAEGAGHDLRQLTGATRAADDRHDRHHEQPYRLTARHVPDLIP